MTQYHEGDIVDGPWAGKRYAWEYEIFEVVPAPPMDFSSDTTWLHRPLPVITYSWDEDDGCWRMASESARRWESVRHEFEEFRRWESVRHEFEEFRRWESVRHEFEEFRR